MDFQALKHTGAESIRGGGSIYARALLDLRPCRARRCRGHAVPGGGLLAGGSCQAEVANDLLGHARVVNDGDNAHRALTDGTASAAGQPAKRAG